MGRRDEILHTPNISPVLRNGCLYWVVLDRWGYLQTFAEIADAAELLEKETRAWKLEVTQEEYPDQDNSHDQENP